MAELLILKEKSTKCEAVVKSSNIMTGDSDEAFFTPKFSSV